MTEQAATVPQIPGNIQHLLNDGFTAHKEGGYALAESVFQEVLDDGQRLTTLAQGSRDGLTFAYGEAYRGQALAAGQLGTPDDLSLGKSQAEKAYNIHLRLSEKYPGVKRFVGADLMSLGRLSTQQHIMGVLRGHGTGGPRTSIVSEWFDLALNLTDGPGAPDQFHINTLWLSSLHHVLRGSRSEGKQQAWRAIRLGLESERKGAPTASPSLKLGERLRARARAIARPAGVLAVAGLIGRTRRPDSGRYFAAHRLAERLIVGPTRSRQLTELRTQWRDSGPTTPRQ